VKSRAVPRVSIIIPAYNQAQFLGEAVSSALAQTYQDCEVIVIDDGSTDNTPEVAKGFPPAVKYFRQENQGVSAANNTAIKMATGEYMLFLASDDVLFENTIEKCVTFMNQHPEAGFCDGQSYTIDENGRPLRSRPRGPRATFIRDGKKEIALLLLGDQKDAAFPFLVRRSCFESVGLFDTKLRMSEDWDMSIRLAKRYAVGHLAEPLLKARFHTNSLTAITGLDILQNAHTAVLESVFKDAELGPLYSHLQNKAYFSLYCLCSRVSARTGHKGTGILYLLSALKTCPVMLVEVRGLSLLIDAAKDFLPRRLRNAIVKTLMSLGLR